MAKEYKRVMLAALGGGILLWVVDAAVDAWFFSRAAFSDTLFLKSSSHEIYFRTLFIVTLLLFGAFIARELTRRRHDQDQLKEALARIEEEKVRSESILAAIGDGISIQSPDLMVLYQNDYHRKLTGGDKRGELCYKAYSEETSVCPECPVIKTFSDGGIHILEKKLVHSKDKVRYIEIKSSPLRDLSGSIIAGIEAVRDITDRKMAMERLTHFSKAIEEAMDGIQIIDLSGRVIYSNKAVETIYGFTAEELNGVDVNQMNADKEIASRVIIPQIRQHGRWSGEVMVLHKNGHPFPVWLSTSLVTDQSGKPVAMIGIIRDITERKNAEDVMKRHREELLKLVEDRTGELSKANEKLRKEIADRERMEMELLKADKLESLGILAGGIAHDFNNLLTSMLGNISVAMMDIVRHAPAYDQLAAAEKAALRAQDLTRQLLTFSKGGTPVKRVNDLGKLVQEASSFALRGSRIRCEISTPPDLRLVNVDEGQISQVIHNLLINADHAMPSGGIVSITCENATIDGRRTGLPLDKGLYVRLSVEDHGVGIPREHLAKIFDPYFTTKQKGSGLGLAMVYSIVKKHGGHIAVESVLGAGSTFRIYLPASTRSLPEETAEETAISRGQGTILIMDDEQEVRETTGNVLKKLGYQVGYASDGNEAIKLFEKEREAGKPYDLVIMDLTVPGGLGGKETITKLLEVDPKVKAIVSSGYSNDPVMSNFREYGFSGVVSKPYRLKELSQEVYRVLHAE